MAVEPTINPHYKDVKAEADAWFKSLLQLKGKAEATFNKTDFGFAAAVWAPSADKGRFRTAVDWANWIFYFDDLYLGQNKDGCNTRYAENIKLSQAQMNHPALQLCTRTVVDLVILSNDILSYKKEMELNDAGNNLVTILKAQKLSDQESMDKIGRMLEACYESWYNALDELPVWGADIDQEVRRYLDACRNVGLGNLHWSFRSGRYFGTSGEEVRKTRILTLPSA
ncbi:hypothetical protein MKX07_003245 [Trichoderma sp. CBMAI-0711]|nr:hypothetical protein MKX07_003245 [Trichoderma sp. CBMAI-0711]